jgi:hypothetical protein
MIKTSGGGFKLSEQHVPHLQCGEHSRAVGHYFAQRFGLHVDPAQEAKHGVHRACRALLAQDCWGVRDQVPHSCRTDIIAPTQVQGLSQATRHPEALVATPSF